MQPSALRALEFDRIVEAVSRIRADADGRRASGRARARRPIRRQVAQLLAATTRNDAVRRRATALFPLRASSDLPQILAALAVEGRALEAAPAARAGRRFSIRSTSRAPASDARPDRSRCSRPRAARRLVQGRDRHRHARKIDPSGEVVGRREPGAARLIRERLRKQQHAAAQHAGVVSARQGNGEIPAGSGRHRAQRPLRPRS